MEPPANMTPTAQGDLTKTPLAHLFVFIAERRLQGSLLLHGDDGSDSSIYWVGGAPGKARTSYPGTHLARVLLQLGYIDDDVMRKTVLQRQQTGTLQGQILLSMGVIDQAKLVAGLREQVMRRLLKIFEKVGDLTTYAFYADINVLADYGGPELTPLEPYRVVWEGLHLRPNDASIDPTLARLGSAPVGLNPQADLRRFGFGPLELKVIELLKVRPMSLAQVLELKLMPIRQLKLLMYTLLITKRIVVAPVKAAAPLAREGQSLEPGIPAHGPRKKTTPNNPPLPTRAVPVARVKPKSVALPASGVAVATAPAQPSSSLGKESILARAAEIESEDYFRVLGITRDDPPDVARSAYFALAKKWHPDRLPNELAEAREVAAKVFARISDAFQTLSDSEKRAQYVTLLDKGTSESEEQAKVQKVIEATIEFQKAEVFMRRRDLANALKSARKAYEGDPEQAPHLALYGWILAQQPEAQEGKMFETSLELLDQAIEMQENCEQAYFYRAVLYKQQGKTRFALRDFRKVADMNPRNIDAIREVRLAEMRGDIKDEPDHKPERKGAGGKLAGANSINWSKDSVSDIFGKLFKKK